MQIRLMQENNNSIPNKKYVDMHIICRYSTGMRTELEVFMNETMLQYVVRKLKDDAFNRAEIHRRCGISKATMAEIANGKNTDPQTSTVQKLHDEFKKLAD